MSMNYIASSQIASSLRKDILTFLDLKNVNSFIKKSFKNTIFNALKVWATIIITFYFGFLLLKQPVSSNLFLIPLIVVFISTRINAINVQIHEASHYLLCNEKKLNDNFANWIFGYFIGIDVDTYRSTHLPHHLYLNEENDPDLPLYSYSNSKKKLFILFLKDLIGVTAITRLLTYSKNQRRNSKRHFYGKAITNLLILSICVSNLGIKLGFLGYILFWIIPLVSFFPIIIRMRTISEHSNFFQSKYKKSTNFISRTTRSNFFEKYFLGAQMEYHFEHHIFPELPFRGQRKLHLLLWKRGYFHEKRNSFNITNAISSGYINSTTKAVKTILLN